MPAQRVLKSWSEAQDQIGAILERINADPGLARAAAANPLFALEEIDYEIDPAVRVEFEDRLRFPPRAAARIGQLRSEIFALAGRPFDLASSADLHRVLFEELKIQQRPPRVKRCARGAAGRIRTTLTREPHYICGYAAVGAMRTGSNLRDRDRGDTPSGTPLREPSRGTVKRKRTKSIPGRPEKLRGVRLLISTLVGGVIL